MIDLNKALKNMSDYKGQIEDTIEIKAENPQFSTSKLISKKLKDHLKKLGIEKLYEHQIQVLDSVCSGNDVLISTPTASGKSLAFMLPILKDYLNGERPSALFLYPTKSLSRDQEKKLQSLMSIENPPKTYSYDGDIDKNDKNKKYEIRQEADLLISNPWGWHHYLQYHYLWSKFFKNLKYVILDEAHSYRGVFGINVAFLIRRIRQVCKFYGSDPLFILSTATVGNPYEFSKNLVGKEFVIIDKDTSGKSKKNFIVWNPPLIDKINFIRRSSLTETSIVFSHLISKNIHTLCFIDDRQMCEQVTRWYKLKLDGENKSGLITSYRGGLLKELRKKIESDMKEEKLKGLISTNALELGMDIGSLDCVVISKYPRNKMSFWQRAGRVCRSENEGWVIFIPTGDPLNQYVSNNFFDFLTNNKHEDLVLDLSNKYISKGQFLCACQEIPLKEEELSLFLKDSLILDSLIKEGEICISEKNTFVYTGEGKCSFKYSIDKTNASDPFKVIWNGRTLENVERPRLYKELHEGAVFTYNTETYLVEKIDYNKKEVYLNKKDVDFYTKTSKSTYIEEIKMLSAPNKNGLSFHDVKVTFDYTHYSIRKMSTVLSKHDLFFPEPVTLQTKALKFTFDNLLNEEKNISDGIHALEHAMIAVSPLVILIDSQDIGGLSYYDSENKKCVIYIYDGYEGGIGLSERIYSKFQEIFFMTEKLLKECPCEDGCPSCIYTSDCSNDNTNLSKKMALKIIEEIKKNIQLNYIETLSHQ